MPAGVHVPLEAVHSVRHTGCMRTELAPPHAQHTLAQVVRQLLSYPSQPAVVLLHTYAWWEARGDGLDRGLFYHPPEQDLTLFAHVRHTGRARWWQ